MSRAFFTSVVLLLIFAQGASAQEKKYEILIGGGIDSPLRPNEFKDEFSLGWTAKLAAGYFVTPQFTLGANLSFNRFGLDKSNIVSIGNQDFNGGDLAVFELAGVGKYYLLPRAKATNFYILGGPGVAFSHVSDFTYRNIAGELVTEPGESNTDFLLTTGVGVKYHLNNRWALFAEGRYSHVFTKGDNTSYLPVRVGIVF